MHRKKKPNLGKWSPVGGKIRLRAGESPHEGARREVEEETGIRLSPRRLRLAGLVTERGYEGGGDWMLFLFRAEVSDRAARAAVAADRRHHREGTLAWFAPEEILRLPLPEADREYFWRRILVKRPRFFAMTLECDRRGIRRALRHE